MNYKNIIKLSVILMLGYALKPLDAQAQYKNLHVSGKAELHYNDVTYDVNAPVSEGEFDFHKIILKAGYKLSDKWTVKSKIKGEHAFTGTADQEVVYLDKAYVDYHVTPAFGIRGGLYSVPLGGSKFKPSFGIETSPVDKYITYSWRELALGVYGTYRQKFEYEVYVMSGLNPEELSAKSGVFSARKSHFRSSDDNLAASARIGYELPHGFNIGVSGLISGLQSKDEFGSELNGANFKLVEGHLVYRRHGFSGRVMGAFSTIKGIEGINQVTQNHLGSSQYGTLLEVGYDVLQYGNNHPEMHLIFFGRGEIYDTQYRTKGIEDNPEYERYEYTFGLVYEPVQRIELKADYQFLQSRGDKQVDQLNLGVALHF